MKLSPNFNLSEFNSKDGAVTPPVAIKNLKELCLSLEVLRQELGSKSIKINSGYRSPKHNEAQGGKSNSQHLSGKAADIVVSGVDPKVVADTIEKLMTSGRMKQGGIGRYSGFTHIDVRGTKARW